MGPIKPPPSWSSKGFQDVGSLIFWTAPWMAGRGQAAGLIVFALLLGNYSKRETAVCRYCLRPCAARGWVTALVSPLLGWVFKTSE